MAKVYECPLCAEEFTSSRIKENDGLCPGCNAELSHTIDRSGGSIVHKWVPKNPESVIQDAEEAEKEHEPVYELLEEGPSGSWQVWQEIKNRAHYVVCYHGRAGDTELRCPRCGSYLHTTNYINGSIQNTYCRNRVVRYSEWEKCNARTDFVFTSFGTRYNPNEI